MNYLFANFKMKLDYPETVNLIKILVQKKMNLKNTKLALCCDYSTLIKASEILKKSKISLASQDIFWENRGAYTGEVNLNNFKKANVKFSIIGHSERRINLNETNQIINKKLINALNNKITPILCIGETLKEKKLKQSKQIIKNQIISALKSINLKNTKKIIIAYEPIWAISSNQGLKVNVEYLNEMNDWIKTVITKNKKISKKLFDDKFNLIYGGNINNKNIDNLIKKTNFQGFLVGTYSTKAENIIRLMDIINK